MQAGPCCRGDRSLEETVLWNMPKFCTEEIWSRTEAGNRSKIAQCGWQVVHQPRFVPDTLLLNDINIASESQESTSRITKLCHSIHVSSCFMHLTEFSKKGKMAFLCFVHEGIAVFQNTVLAHRFSHLVFTLFDGCELRLWLGLILCYLSETSLLLKINSSTIGLQFLHLKVLAPSTLSKYQLK